MIVVDVRSKREYESGHVPGARHLPFWAVPFRTGALHAQSDTPIIVYCGHGPRAWIAKGLLRLRGFQKVSLLAGHMRRWRRQGKPLE